VLRGLPPEVGVISAIAFCVALGFGIVAPAIPIYAKSFGVSSFAAGAVISVFAGMRLLSAPVAGLAIDRIGERRILTWGLLIVSVSSILAGLARDYPELLALRGIGGVGSSMFTVSAMALMLKVVAANQRGRAAGAFQAGFLLGGVAGPAVGGLVLAWSVRAPFFVYAVTLLLAAAVAWRLLPGEPPGQPVREDSAAPTTAGFDREGNTARASDGSSPDTATATTPDSGQERHKAPDDPLPDVPALPETAAPTDFVPSSNSRPATELPPTDPIETTPAPPPLGAPERDDPSPDASAPIDTPAISTRGQTDPPADAGQPEDVPPTLRQALGNRAYWAALLANLTTGFVTFGLRFSLVPLFVVEGLRADAWVAGVGFLIAAATQAILLLPAGRLSDERGRRPALLIGGALTVLGMVALAVSGASWMFLAAMAISGTAAAFMGSAPAATAGDVVGASGKGTVIAVFQMTADLGSIVGPLLAGLLADSLGFGAAFAVGAAVASVALVAAGRMQETLVASAKEHSSKT